MDVHNFILCNRLVQYRSNIFKGAIYSIRGSLNRNVRVFNIFVYDIHKTLLLPRIFVKNVFYFNNTTYVRMFISFTHILNNVLNSVHASQC